MVKCPTLLLCVAAFALFRVTPCRAVTIHLSPEALQRTLLQQLFKDPGQRYYIRGHPGGGCFVSAEDPRVSLRDGRVVVHVHAHARLGSSVGGACLGVGFGTEADVTLMPVAEGETIGFRDPRIENLSAPRELGALLEPFLSRKLPQQMKLNAADLLRKTLAASQQRTGYDLRMPAFQIHSMAVENGALVVDVDGELDVQ